MCSCLPTLPRHAQGSLMSVRIVPEDRSTSAEAVVEIPRYTGWVSGLRGVRAWSGVEKCSCREWLTGSCVATLLGNSQGSLMSVGIVSEAGISSA